MAYSDCPKADMLTQRLVAAYQRTGDSDAQTDSLIEDLHSDIMEHKSSCIVCKKIMIRKPTSILGSWRVA